ncbi:MAG: penicillin-binding protein 2 [Candidatus Sungbacteria bacterium RIFCSPHIGHO2_02_FULL_47_11]|uniref:Penicillin-binding protein 2 n=1 Tax=Candidatus Sungbacteria bacterium RIFCSPHIGHO2_02_FULL_47_11 TaxID=1802270 RepID=A0A1G2KIA3_9BACT|nr:MAG: penicillin-binding protein 2 [Candidatus Sungbacteria bacterium RIFCSPHIGHO2_02_FULL_47_11]
MKFQYFKKKSYSGGFLDPDEILADSTSSLSILHSSEGKLERSLGALPLFIFLFLTVGGMAYLGLRAAVVQIEEGEAFFAMSQENRFLVRSVFPPRGAIYDRFQKPLVRNVPSFGLLLDKKEFLEKGGDLSELVLRLESLLRQANIPLPNTELAALIGAKELPEKVFLVRGIEPEALIALAPHLDSFPGVQIFETYRREYRDSFAFSHILGFIGKVSPEDLAVRQELRDEETVGKNGIEAFYDEKVRGERGRKIVEVDSSGNETRFRLTQEPRRGSELILSLDGDFQEVAYRTVENYTSGNKAASIVILDPRDGAVRTLVSYPGFNSNKFGSALSSEEFQAVLKNPLKPLFNRALGGEFPPGSIFKPLLAAAVLTEKLIDPAKKIYDEGFIEIPHPYRPGERSVFLDWKKHGWIDFYDAIAYSANVYFYMVGGGYQGQQGLGIERIKQYATVFGLGSLLGIDLPGEKQGLIPDPRWKEEHEPNDPLWRVGDTYNVSIGQGGVKITPLQITAVTAAIANGGTLYRPRVLEAFLDGSGVEYGRVAPEVIRSNIVAEEHLAEVRRGMRRTVTSGTARMLGSVPVAVAAKTGTAQVGGSLLPHAWVTAFAPVENPEIAITVMVENAGEGATVAVPIANEILKWYFENRTK